MDLSSDFKKNGYRVFLSSRVTSRLLTTFCTPDILILSHVFSLKQSLLNYIKLSGTLIYVNEVEGEIEGNDVGISGTYPLNVDYSNFEGILVWSDWSKKWLAKNRLVDINKIHVIGSIRNSLLKFIIPKKVKLQ